MSNKYKSIQVSTEGIFKDRGSKFIAFLFACATPVAFEEELKKVKKLHPKSRHFCYAYRLLDGERTNDDGEPSGTAGKPIMGQIIKADLKNVGIIVVRYFGGTLLGTGGLIRAYKSAAAESIASATVIQMETLVNIEIIFDYQHLSDLMSSIKKHQYIVKSQNLGEEASLVLSVAPDDTLTTIRQIKSDVGHLYLSEVHSDTQIHGIKFSLSETS